MKQFIGHDITDVFMAEGEPVHVFDLPDGQRAYQYYWGGGAAVIPGVSTTTAHVSGGSGYATTVTSPAGIVSSKGCLITYIGTREDSGKRWTVTAIDYPRRAFC